MLIRRLVVFLIILTCILLSGCKSNNHEVSGKTGEIIQHTKENPTNHQSSAQNSPDPGTEEETKPSQETDYRSYDNKRYAWFLIRRSDHLPPETGNELSRLAKKYNAIYLGDTSRKVVYLTFDEGYENGFTATILDILKENNVKATFFITMPYLNNHTDLVERMTREGHIVGNHTVNHPSLPEVLDDRQFKNEIEALGLAYKEITGMNMKYLRPPKGEFSERTLKISSDLGYRNVFWSFAYDDWDINNQKGADYAYKMVMDNVHNGCVLLLHAVSSSNTEALGRIIRDLKSQGYSFGTLDEIK